MAPEHLQELRAEFQTLMALMRGTEDLDEKHALLKQANLIIYEVDLWIRQSNKRLQEIRERLRSRGI